MCEFFKTKLNMPDVTLPEIYHAFGVLKTNAIGLHGCDARGLYPVISLMSHSCVSNLDPMVQMGNNFGFKAQRKIPEGEELTIRYLQVLEHRLFLRTQFAENWMFECACARCKDPTEMGSFLSSPKCRECAEGHLIPLRPLQMESDWKCDRCNGSLAAKTVKQLEVEARAIVASVDLRNFETISDTIQSLEKSYHPDYVQIVNLKIAYNALELDSIVDHSDDERVDLIYANKIRFCADLLRVLEKIDPGTTKLRKQTYATLAKARLFVVQKKKRAAAVTKEEFVKEMKVCLSLQKLALQQ